MRQYFQTPQFARVGKLFQDLPLEALDKSMTGLNNIYNKNVEDFNKVDAALGAIAVSAGDDEYKQEKVRKLRAEMEEFAKNGKGFENATAFIGRKAADILNDRELTAMQENYKLMQEDEAMARQLRAQGINPIDARKILNGTDDFRTISLDENGNRILNSYKGGYMRPGDYDKVKSGFFDNMPKRGSTSFVRQPDGSMKQVTWSGIRDQDIENYASEALDRYKSTDTYKTELIDLQTQGYTPEQADALISESLIAAGKERVGTQSSSRLYGYENPNVTAARAAKAAASKAEAARKENRFVQEASTLKETDPNGILGLFGSKDTANLPINGYSTAYTDPTTKNYDLTNYFTLEKGNSDKSGGGKMQNTPLQAPMSHVGNVQVFVTADTNELFMTGDGSSTEAGRHVPEGERPRTDSYGRYFVQDKDGKSIYLKPMNVKQYIGMGEDNAGDRYFVPMNRNEEYNLMGAAGAVNSKPVELGRPMPGGARAVDNFDNAYIENTLRDISNDAEQSYRTNNAVMNYLQRLQASSDDTDSAIWDEVSRKIQERPAKANYLLDTLYEILNESRVTVKGLNDRSAEVFNAKGSKIAPVINAILGDFEDSRTLKQMPKEDISFNIMGADSNAIGDLED